MTYAIRLSPVAARQLRKFDPTARRRLQAAIELLAADPRPPAAKLLVGGAGEWRVRTDDYRVVYEIHESVLVVLVLSMGTDERSLAESRVVVGVAVLRLPGSSAVAAVASRIAAVRAH